MYERLALQAEEYVARLTLRKKDMSGPGITNLQQSRLAASKQAKTAENMPRGWMPASSAK